MGIGQYRSVLALREVRRVLWLSLVVRIPLWAGNVVLTLHVVTHLNRSYSAAGLLVGVATVTLAVSAPWLGRRLDRVGLRVTLGPCLLVLVACWSVAPFVSYWPLLVLAAVGGLFTIPSFTIVRQALLHVVPVEMRKTALSIDSVALEVSFMIGPVVGVLLATSWSTPWALLSCELTSVLGGIVFWIVDPPMGTAGADAEGHISPRSWVTPGVLAVLAVGVAATVVLTGTDVSIVAALRHMHHPSLIGGVLALWGLGSAIGGIVYGAMHRTVPAFLLLGLLAALTIPAVLARGPLTLALLLVLAGLFCAPTITATVDTLSRIVPERVRGEAMGWHSSALTTGSAAGAPLAGVAIDRAGWQGGLWLPSVIGIVVAALGLAATRRRAAVAAAREAPRLQNANS
ncbi:MAG TPA: MFS transporter [Jatrophihabitans sp.]|jgi:MFS family permease